VALTAVAPRKEQRTATTSTADTPRRSPLRAVGCVRLGPLGHLGTLGHKARVPNGSDNTQRFEGVASQSGTVGTSGLGQTGHCTFHHRGCLQPGPGGPDAKAYMAYVLALQSAYRERLRDTGDADGRRALGATSSGPPPKNAWCRLYHFFFLRFLFSTSAWARNAWANVDICSATKASADRWATNWAFAACFFRALVVLLIFI